MRVFWILKRRPKYTSAEGGLASSASSPAIAATVDAQNNNYLSKTYLDTGPGRLTKRGYHKLSDGGCGGSDDCPIVQLQDSEAEGTSSSSFSGTDCSDFDPDREVESDSESEEALTCNVCDRSFPSTRKLAQHQQRKRHFGCSICDSIFPTLMTLELHKESLEHWSDDEGIAQGCSPSDEDSDDDHDDDDNNIHSPTEELERLL